MVVAGKRKNFNWVKRQFFALYGEDIPNQIEFGGKLYIKEKTFKYDFFAGTGLYKLQDGAEKIVVKIYRQRAFFGLPTKWIGKLLVSREIKFYKKLSDIEGVPKFLGRVDSTGFAHEYIPGRPLARDLPVPDDFFDRFEDLLKTIHSKGIAYIDLNKPSNVLLGDDDRPYLIDFQISYSTSNLPIFRSFSKLVLSQLQCEDWYHFGKLKRRIRPDLLSEEELQATYNCSLLIRFHRFITRPYFIIRRWAMKKLDLKSVE